MKKSRTVLLICFLLMIATVGAGTLFAAPDVTKPQTQAFRDTYSRVDDGSSPADSLGTTESKPGKLTVLDYRELGGCCNTPSVGDFAFIEGESLVVTGRGTTVPAWVELDGAGYDYNLKIDVEFLITDSANTANNLSLLLRTASPGGSNVIFTPGQVLFDMLPNGDYVVRGVRNNGGIKDFTIDFIPYDVFKTADLDGDGLLEVGEPFSVRLKLKDNFFSLEFNDATIISELEITEIPEGGQRLLFGRNRWNFFGDPVDIRFDNLKSNGPRN